VTRRIRAAFYFRVTRKARTIVALARFLRPVASLSPAGTASAVRGDAPTSLPAGLSVRSQGTDVIGVLSSPLLQAAELMS